MAINRVAKVVKGGRRFSFTALVVVGDEDQIVGVGYGKANEVPLAIQKAVERAKKSLFRVPKHHSTITHQVMGRYGSGQVLLKPASEGTGVIAGGAVRAVLELAGIKDVLSKSLGAQNPINLTKATVTGLRSLRRPEDVAELRGKTVAEVLGLKSKEPVTATTAGAAPNDGPAGATEMAPARARSRLRPQLRRSNGWPASSDQTASKRERHRPHAAGDAAHAGAPRHRLHAQRADGPAIRGMLRKVAHLVDRRAGRQRLGGSNA